MDDGDELARVRRSQHGLARNWNECLAEKEQLQQRVYALEGELEECKLERNMLAAIAFLVVGAASALHYWWGI